MLRLRIRVGEGITGRAVLDQEPIASSDAHVDPRAALVPGTRPEPEAILCVPLTARARRLGALTLYRRGSNRAFSNDELELARQFADVAAIALHNANTLAEFQRLALTDDLTGLANRRGFREELERLAASAERHAIPLSLLLLDVDNFKEVNDEHGHAAGDEILREIALMLRQRIRASDLAARIGGDEFAVLLPHTSEEEAAVVARDLITHLGEGRATSLPLRVSVGVASGTEALDNALFYAGRSGALRGEGARSLLEEAGETLLRAREGSSGEGSFLLRLWRRAERGARARPPNRGRAAADREPFLPPRSELVGRSQPWERDSGAEHARERAKRRFSAQTTRNRPRPRLCRGPFERRKRRAFRSQCDFVGR